MTDGLLGMALARVADRLAVAHAAPTPHAVVAAWLTEVTRETGLPITALTETAPEHRGLHVAVLDLPDGASLSLGFCPPLADPWLLLAARSWSERDVLRVDGTPLRIHDVIRFLDSMWRDRDLLRQLVDLCIVRDEIRRRGLTVDDVEIQEATDALRRGMGLTSAEATYRWLEERGLTEGDLEGYGRDHAMIARLRAEVVPPPAVDLRCTAQPAAGDELTVLRARFATRTAATAFSKSAPPIDAPLARLIEGLDLGCLGFEIAVIRRLALPVPARAAAYLGAAIEHAHGDQHWVTVVLAVRPGGDDAHLRDIVEQELFEEWLAQRRARSKIEWYWGKDADAS